MPKRKHQGGFDGNRSKKKTPVKKAKSGKHKGKGNSKKARECTASGERHRMRKARGTPVESPKHKKNMLKSIGESQGKNYKYTKRKTFAAMESETKKQIKATGLTPPNKKKKENGKENSKQDD